MARRSPPLTRASVVAARRFIGPTGLRFVTGGGTGEHVRRLRHEMVDPLRQRRPCEFAAAVGGPSRLGGRRGSGAGRKASTAMTAVDLLAEERHPDPQRTTTDRAGLVKMHGTPPSHTRAIDRFPFAPPQILPGSSVATKSVARRFSRPLAGRRLLVSIPAESLRLPGIDRSLSPSSGSR